jgi:hypothetical protein
MRAQAEVHSAQRTDTPRQGLERRGAGVLTFQPTSRTVLGTTARGTARGSAQLLSVSLRQMAAANVIHESSPHVRGTPPDIASGKGAFAWSGDGRVRGSDGARVATSTLTTIVRARGCEVPIGPGMGGRNAAH